MSVEPDGPVEGLASFEVLADRVARVSPRAGSRARSLLEQLEALDVAIYRAVAQSPTPALDHYLRTLSDAADYSRLWVGVAGALALVGGRRGRAAAVDGLLAIGATSAVVNQTIKRAAERSRPDRVGGQVPELRHVPMPGSTSFPSGHSASAFAFAAAASRRLPVVAVPLHLLAGAVAYSRIHTGVHYPGDVVAGSVLGTASGEMVSSTLAWARRRRRTRPRH